MHSKRAQAAAPKGGNQLGMIAGAKKPQKLEIALGSQVSGEIVR